MLRRSGTSHPLESNDTPDGLRQCFLRHLPSFISAHSISSALCPQTRHERAAGNRESLRGGAALRPPGRLEHKLLGPWLNPSTDSAACVVRDMPLRWTTRPCFPSCLLLCRTKRRFYLETCLKSTTSTRGERVSPICLTGGLLHHQLLIIKPHSVLTGINIFFFDDRTFLRELEQYTDCPELVGRCFLQRVSG